MDLYIELTLDTMDWLYLRPLVRYRNLTQHLYWSYRGNKPRAHLLEEIIIQGDKAAITLNSSQSVHVKCDDGRELTPEVKGDWFPDAFGNSMAHFVDALDNDRPFYCEGRDNLKSAAVIEATYISAAENRVVFPDELL